MSLQFIFGNSGSGKSHWLYDTIIKEADHNPQKNYLVIVPEQFTAQTERDLVAMHPCGGIMNIEVLSFQRLAYRVFEDVGKDGRIVLSETGKNLMVRRVAQEKKDELDVLNAQINRIGFVSKIKSVLSELMQYEITDDDLDGMIESSEDHSLLHTKLEDIKVIYNEFRRYQNDSFVKPEELMDLLADKVKYSNLLKNSALAFDGYAGFTPLEIKVLEELLSVCPKIYLTVTIDAREDFFREGREHELFAPAKRLIKSAADAAKNAGIEEPVVLGPLLLRFSKGGALEHLEQNLFRKNARPYPGDSDKISEEISLHALTSSLQEVHFVARTISELVREKGYRYRDIAVIAGDLGVYGNYVTRIFPLYDIPLFLDQTHQVLQNPCLEFVRGALAIVQDDFSRASVFRYLRTGMAGLLPEETDRLENHVIAAGISGRHRWEQTWERPAGHETDEDLKELDALRARFMERILPFADEMAKRDQTLENYAIALVQLMEECSLQKQLEKRREILEDEGQKEEAAQYEQIYAVVMKVLEEMVDLLGDEEVNCREFSEILDAGLEGAKIGIIPSGLDQVLVGDIRRSRLSDIKVLFFVGLNDGSVPENADEGGIISDTEREILRDKGANLAPSARENSYIQRYYLYQNLTKPKEKLYLSWCEIDTDGEPMRPSYLVSEIRSLFPEMGVVSEGDAGTDLKQVTSRKNGMLYLLHGLQKVREPKGAGYDSLSEEELANWKELYRFYLTDKNHPAFREYVQELTEAAFVDVISKPQNLYPATARDLYLTPGISGPKMDVNVTQLEKFAGCPFSYFATRGLRLQKRDEFVVSYMDLGNMFHKAMELFSRALPNWGDQDFEVEAAQMDACVDQAVKEYDYILKDSARQAYTVSRLKRILRRTLQALRAQRTAGKFLVSDVERSFPDDEIPASFKVNAGITVVLNGRIDRIDTFETLDAVYVKVVDYKSGSKGFKLSSLYDGEQLQLAVYLNEAVKMEEKKHPGKKIIPAGAFYLQMQDPVLQKEKDPDKALAKLLDKMRPDGLINKEDLVLKLYDKELKETSHVIRVSFKDGKPKDKDFLVTTDAFQAILSDTGDLLQEMAAAILDGDVAVSPLEGACKYCPYMDVCGRDKKIPGQAVVRKSGILAPGVKKENHEDLKGGDGT